MPPSHHRNEVYPERGSYVLWQLTSPCTKAKCRLAMLASLSEGGPHFHRNHTNSFAFRTRTWKPKTMDAKLSTKMNTNVSTDSAAVVKRKVPYKTKGKNSSKGSVQPSAAKPSQPMS